MRALLAMTVKKDTIHVTCHDVLMNSAIVHHVLTSHQTRPQQVLYTATAAAAAAAEGLVAPLPGIVSRQNLAP